MMSWLLLATVGLAAPPERAVARQLGFVRIGPRVVRESRLAGLLLHVAPGVLSAEDEQRLADTLGPYWVETWTSLGEQITEVGRPELAWPAATGVAAWGDVLSVTRGRLDDPRSLAALHDEDDATWVVQLSFTQVGDLLCVQGTPEDPGFTALRYEGRRRDRIRRVRGVVKLWTWSPHLPGDQDRPICAEAVPETYDQALAAGRMAIDHAAAMWGKRSRRRSP